MATMMTRPRVTSLSLLQVGHPLLIGFYILDI